MSTSTLPYPLLCVAIAMRAFEARDAYMARARDPATQFAAADWVAIARYYNGVGIGWLQDARRTYAEDCST
jgi:hypothetical protein